MYNTRKCRQHDASQLWFSYRRNPDTSTLLLVLLPLLLLLQQAGD
jgi:hypothetical protein